MIPPDKLALWRCMATGPIGDDVIFFLAPALLALLDEVERLYEQHTRLSARIMELEAKSGELTQQIEELEPTIKAWKRLAMSLCRGE